MKFHLHLDVEVVFCATRVADMVPKVRGRGKAWLLMVKLFQI